MIEESSWCRDNNVHAFAQLCDLRIDADATVYNRCPEGQMLPVTTHTFGDLGGQFPGGSQHEGTDTAPIGGAMLEALQHWQREACGLAGARLGTRKDITAFENKGYSLLLDRGCRLVTLFFDRTQQFGRKAELIE